VPTYPLQGELAVATMRFGRDLHKHQTPEWASSYVRYAELKKLSKFAAKAVIKEKSNVADLLQKLKVALRSGIAAVETFYTRQYAILEQRAAVLRHRYDRGASSLSLTSFAINEIDLQGAEEVLATCLELCLGFKKLQWYGKVNRDGFSNILGKLKRLPITNVDDCMLYQCEFAGQYRSIEILDRIDKTIVRLDADFSTRSRGASFILGTIQSDGSDVEDLPFHRIVIRIG
jgi:glycerophosphodiester phosphodiesterase